MSNFIYLHLPILMNNMLLEDDCNLAACLIQLRGPAVLNKNASQADGLEILMRRLQGVVTAIQ